MFNEIHRYVFAAVAGICLSQQMCFYQEGVLVAEGPGLADAEDRRQVLTFCAGLLVSVCYRDIACIDALSGDYLVG